MTKVEIQMLENVWMAEVSGELPFQTKSEVALKLTQDNFLQHDAAVISGVKVEGFSLTHAGRIYCCLAAEGAEPGQGEAI
jgi:hypothetical protein